MNDTRLEISAGTLLRPGDRMPTFKKAAAEYSTTRSTVARAYEELAAEGFLVRHPFRGYYVAESVALIASVTLQIEAFAMRLKAAGYPAHVVDHLLHLQEAEL